MINKILNLYFSNYYKRLISNYTLHWYIDTRFIKRFGRIYLEIKMPHFKDDCYSPIYSWNEEDSLYHIVNYEDSVKIIKSNIEDYLKYTKGE